MINIVNKEDCVGCNACVQRCPVSCISMHRDDQGFMYPKVNLDRCINCSLCEKVCPVLEQGEEREPLKVFAAVNPNQGIRSKSSSGGVFRAIAESVINQGGVVFGARFDSEWNVIHAYTETIEGLAPMMGAKYVQSEIGSSFIDAESFLKAGRKVLFSGTPCQIAGLKLFLRKEYESLITVEVVCHGVPSPLVWKSYLESVRKNKGFGDISAISFRDKRYGWERYSLNIVSSDKGTQSKQFNQNLTKNPYLRGFVKNLYLRPSCYFCPAKSGKSRADITLGDFWHIRHIHPELYHFNGVSLVLDYTDNGRRVLDSADIITFESDYTSALKANPAIVHNSKKGADYKLFWESFKKDGISCLQSIIKRLSDPTLSMAKATLTNRAKILLSGLGFIKP